MNLSIISKQKIIIDGSHRVANSIIKKHKTLCCEFDTEDLFFDFNFFLKRGFKRKYCDYIGFTIIDLVKNITFLKIHFTNKKKLNKEEKLIKHNILMTNYRKCIYFSYFLWID